MEVEQAMACNVYFWYIWFINVYSLRACAEHMCDWEVRCAYADELDCYCEVSIDINFNWNGFFWNKADEFSVFVWDL